MKYGLIVVSSVVTGGMLAGGCAQRRYDPPPSVVHDQTEYPQVVVSPDLAGWLAADRPVVGYGETGQGPLVVTVPVRTLVSKGETIRVQYKYTFLDGQGRPIAPDGDWRYVRMPANTQRFFEGNALDQRAQDWQLEIRTAR